MPPLADLVGESAGISAIRAQIGRLLQHQRSSGRLPPILILGETGTGKGLLARVIHRASVRGSKPFVPINCAAIPDTLLEAELFGFERGAFTDARQGKPGLFQSANGGTLFLDEIAAMPVSLQAKLLTALEDRTVRRLGSTRAEPLDVWILAATSEELGAATRERRFREDLYHRLSTMPVVLPPLRERPSDITLLAEHFLSKLCAEYGLAPKRLAPDAKAALEAHAWPGNVRELANLMERVAMLVEGPSISRADLDLRGHAPAPARDVIVPRDADRSLRESVGDFERARLTGALEAAAGNLSRAAALLGIPRNTFRYRLEKYGLRPDPAPAPGARGSRHVDTAAVRRPVAFLWAEIESPPMSASRGPGQPRAERRPGQGPGVRRRARRDHGHSRGGRFPADVADGASRAAHAALSIQRAVGPAETAGPIAMSTRAAIHVTECRTGPGPAGEPLHPADQAEAVAEVNRLASGIAPGTMLVTASAVPFVTGRPGLSGGSSANVSDVQGPPRPNQVLVLSTSPVSHRPSIAVLPFRDLSGDPGQEYFGDGITEDIIGALSRIRWLFVISRTSTLVYRSKIADLRQIARELNVGYVVTGTVRKAGSQLRVTADLIDARAGNTIWADHYDGALANVFEFQDRITSRIVGTLESTLRITEAQRALQKHPDSFDAYDCVLRAFTLLYRLSPDEFLQAGELLAKAIALDPNFAAAYAWRAWWYLLKFGQGW